MTLSLVLLILPYAAETYAMPSCVPLVILWCSCRPMEPTRTRWVRLRVGFKTHIFFFHLSFFPSLSLEEIMVVMETRALSNTKLKTFITAHAQAMFFLLILVKQFSHFWVSGSNAHYIRHVWRDIISYLCGPLSLSLSQAKQKSCPVLCPLHSWTHHLTHPSAVLTSPSTPPENSRWRTSGIF